MECEEYTYSMCYNFTTANMLMYKPGFYKFLATIINNEIFCYKSIALAVFSHYHAVLKDSVCKRTDLVDYHPLYFQTSSRLFL